MDIDSNKYEKYNFITYSGYQIFDMHLHLNYHFDQYFKFPLDEVEHYMKTIAEKGIFLMPTIGNSWENPDHCNGVDLTIEFLNNVNSYFGSKKKIWKYAWFHPHEANDGRIKNLKFDGIKYHPSISQVPITEARDLLEIAAKRKIPFIIHTGRNEKSDMKYLLKVVDDYSDIPIIAAHMGGLATPKVLQTLKTLIKNGVPNNLFLETSGAFNPNVIRYATDVMGSNKILYGSDLPFFHPEICIYAIKRAMFGREEDLKRILFQNSLNIVNNKWRD